MRRGQQGQSVAGFLVASVFILVPAFIGLTFLAKTGDMKFRAQEASRYAAWEKTVWEASGGHAKGDTELGWEVRNRVFARAESRLDSEHDKTSRQNQPLDTLAYTRYAQQRGRQPMLANIADNDPGVQLNTSALSAGGTLGELNDQVAEVLKLDVSGYRRADVEVALARANQDHLPVGQLSLKTRYVIMDDAWNAASPQRATESIRRMVPTALLDNGAVSTIQSIVGTVFDDLSPRNFKPGKVDVEVAPCQRLAAYRPGEMDAPRACLE